MSNHGTWVFTAIYCLKLIKQFKFIKVRMDEEIPTNFKERERKIGAMSLYNDIITTTTNILQLKLRKKITFGTFEF